MPNGLLLRFIYNMGWRPTVLGGVFDALKT
jgi:hypothetical protein